MPQLNITELRAIPPSERPIEIVERKGLGHPDTICDALAEELSRRLCRCYLEKFGFIMHHNVDKGLLWGGAARPAYKGGEVLAPIEIFIGGRATCEYKGIKMPLEEIVTSSSLDWLRAHFHVLDPDRHIKIHSLIRPGSADLVELYLRQEQAGNALANDTSCGVGYAPLSELERLVLYTEQYLNSADVKLQYPEIGEDIKIMGVRRNNLLELTVACAFVDRHVADAGDYVQKKSRLAALIKTAARSITAKSLLVTVNAADDPSTESFYLTVTGTSAESGDDGEVGRGNRVNGLITPYRPMNMEAAAGKNPVTHVGKLYNLVARQIAELLVDGVDEVKEAYCYLLSRIGSPVIEPRIVDIQLNLHAGVSIAAVASRAEDIVRDGLSGLSAMRQDLIEGAIQVY